MTVRTVTATGTAGMGAVGTVMAAMVMAGMVIAVTGPVGIAMGWQNATRTAMSWPTSGCARRISSAA